MGSTSSQKPEETFSGTARVSCQQVAPNRPQRQIPPLTEISSMRHAYPHLRYSSSILWFSVNPTLWPVHCYEGTAQARPSGKLTVKP